MKRAGIRLSDKQLLFVTEYLSGKSKTEAAAVAGYADKAVWGVLEGARMRAAIAVVLENFLVGDAAPAALRALYSIVSDEKVAAGVRVSAANSLLDRAGFDAKRLAAKGDDGKDISTMTVEDLRAEIDKLQAQLEGKAVDVTPVGEPDSEPVTSQELDLYE